MLRRQDALWDKARHPEVGNWQPKRATAAIEAAPVVDGIAPKRDFNPRRPTVPAVATHLTCTHTRNVSPFTACCHGWR